ncbi:MAG: DUF4402 domain-containing protein [Sphingomonadaceae bacterium]|nr:DUF4402 domain-containing protein [Sphingomonadaceae bacterium]
MRWQWGERQPESAVNLTTPFTGFATRLVYTLPVLVSSMKGPDFISGMCRLVMRMVAALGVCLAAMGPLALPAHAQSVAAPIEIVVLKPLSILKTEDIDFGNILVNGAGTVDLTPSANPTCTTSANLIHSGNCQPAEFVGVGSVAQLVRFRRPAGNNITLTGPGTDMVMDNITIDGSPTMIFLGNFGRNSRFLISSLDGYWEIRVGGTLNVPANQTAGVYSGTLQIDVAYF